VTRYKLDSIKDIVDIVKKNKKKQTPSKRIPILDVNNKYTTPNRGNASPIKIIIEKPAHTRNYPIDRNQNKTVDYNQTKTYHAYKIDWPSRVRDNFKDTKPTMAFPKLTESNLPSLRKHKISTRQKWERHGSTDERKIASPKQQLKPLKHASNDRKATQTRENKFQRVSLSRVKQGTADG